MHRASGSVPRVRLELLFDLLAFGVVPVSEIDVGTKAMVQGYSSGANTLCSPYEKSVDINTQILRATMNIKIQTCQHNDLALQTFCDILGELYLGHCQAPKT